MSEPPKSVALAFNGSAIRDKGETLSLTDMWKAAGDPANQDPAQWMRTVSAEAFIEAVAVNMGKSHNEVVKAVRGGKTPGTWAHWQIALAYAKYLSPDFHMWCNTVVRERMEGRPAAGAFTVAALDPGVANAIGGIVKKVVNARLEEFAQAILPGAVQAHIADRFLTVVSGVTAGEVCQLSSVADKYPHGISNRTSRRLSTFCQRANERMTMGRLGRTHATLFPIHAARQWLDLEGRVLIRRWIEERRGQTSLHLVGGK